MKKAFPPQNDKPSPPLISLTTEKGMISRSADIAGGAGGRIGRLFFIAFRFVSNVRTERTKT